MIIYISAHSAWCTVCYVLMHEKCNNCKTSDHGSFARECTVQKPPLVVLQTAAWETARLRVRATSLAAENDALKSHVAQLMHQISNMDRSVQARQCTQQLTDGCIELHATLANLRSTYSTSSVFDLHCLYIPGLYNETKN